MALATDVPPMDWVFILMNPIEMIRGTALQSAVKSRKARVIVCDSLPWEKRVSKLQDISCKCEQKSAQKGLAV